MTKHIATSGLFVLALLEVWACTPASAQVKQAKQDQPAGIPEMSLGAKDYPDTDAVILRREQSWTVGQDGSLRRRDHQWVKLLNSRAIGAFADPRIDYCVGQDEMTIHTARTILPDGKALPVEDYAFNKAGPDDVSGWAQYAGWVQTVICFPGIEDGCVLELDYEIVSKPGTYAWAEADLRLNEDYPAVRRVVSVTVPEGGAVFQQIDGLQPAPAPEKVAAEGGATTFRWTFEKLAAAPGEPQSLPWQKRCGRLRFTTCPGADTWVSAMIKAVDDAAQPNEAVKKFAEAAVEKEPDGYERIRKVAKKLADSFNFVGSWKTLHPLLCRDAGEVLRANYGNPLESAALLAAALKSLGMKASVELAVDAIAWDAKTPTESAFAGVTVLVDSPDGAVRVHPQFGIIRSPGSWGRHVVIGLDASGKAQPTYLEVRGEKAGSQVEIGGKITIGADGKATGDLRIRLAGAFYDPAGLETTAQQEALIKGLVGRVLGDCEVTSCSTSALSDEALKATAKVASKGELKAIGKSRMLRLGDGAALLNEFPLPLGRSYRKTDVYVGGRPAEEVDLTIELPKDWAAEILPTAVARAAGSWGSAERTVDVNGTTIRVRRSVTVAADPIPAKDFTTAREAVNSLRSKGGGMIVAGPAEKPAEKPPEKALEKAAGKAATAG